jgi:superfamily II DNA/RNA helicase
VDVVAKSLAKHGFDAAPIHGDLDQSVRMNTLDKFRSGELKILVASDVAARGLDVPSVSHVFNFDVPIHADDYVHRIGRTGRAGRSGHAFMLASPRDAKHVEAIEKLTHKPLARRSMMDIEVRDDHRRPARQDRGGRGRDRGGKDKDHHRDRRPPGGKYHDQVAATQPVEANQNAVPADEPPAEQPKVERPAAERKQAPRAETRHGHRGQKPQRQPTQGQSAVDKSELPAFLFRPVPVRKPEPQPE